MAREYTRRDRARAISGAKEKRSVSRGRKTTGPFTASRLNGRARFFGLVRCARSPAAGFPCLGIRMLCDGSSILLLGWRLRCRRQWRQRRGDPPTMPGAGRSMSEAGTRQIKKHGRPPRISSGSRIFFGPCSLVRTEHPSAMVGLRHGSRKSRTRPKGLPDEIDGLEIHDKPRWANDGRRGELRMVPPSSCCWETGYRRRAVPSMREGPDAARARCFSDATGRS